MADNFNYTPGTGGVGASDDVGGVHYPKVKLASGQADSSTMIYEDIGAKANALRVCPANDITDATYIGDIKFGEAEPNSAAILADTTAIKTAIELLDNSVDGNYLNVNVNLAGTDITAGAGAVAAGTPRVTLASDDPAVALLTTIDADTGAIKTAVELLDNAVDGNYLNTNMNLAGTDAQAGEGVISASTLRVTIATDDDGIAHLATIAGDTTSIDGKITACNTGAVVISSGAIAGDVANDAVDSGNPIKIGGRAVNTDGTAPGTAVAEADRVDFITDLYGRQCVETTHPNFWTTNTQTYAGAQTNTSLVAAPGAGLSLYITDIVFSNGATAGIITLLDGSGGTEKAGGYFAINGGMVWPINTPIKLTANTALCLTSTSVTTHKVTVNGYIAP